MNRRRLELAISVSLVAMGVQACAPKVHLEVAPQVLSSEWRGRALASGRVVGDQGLGAAFKCPELDGLISRALAANADLGAARARVAQARGQLKIARAAMLPVVSGSAGANRTRTDNTGGSLFNFSDAFAGLDISWDADVFGGGRAERRRARSGLEAAKFDRDATALSVEAEVARAYVQQAVLAERLKLLDRNLASARELQRVVGVRVREGEGTRLEAGLQAIEVRQLEADRPRLVEALSKSVNALAVLLGEEAPLFEDPGGELDGLSTPALRPVQPGGLLVRRPDLRAAEARISAASGDVEQARAAFLPNLRLTASGLAQAATLSGPYGVTLIAGASLLGPIFNGGRLRGQLSVATAAQAETVELYRRTLLTALAEAEDALAAVEQSEKRSSLLDAVVEEARTAARLTRLQFVEGEADLRALIYAQQLLVQAEDSRALSLQERMNAAIDLYRAMGGRPLVDDR